MKSQTLATPAMPVHFTTGNFMLVVLGTFILGLGLYRMFPLQLSRSFYFMNGPLAMMLLAGFVILRWQHANTSFLEWGQQTALFAGSFLPLMILLCLVMAIGRVITGIHEAAIQGFLLKHQVIGPFVAALVTPTSNALVPVVESSWKIRSLQPMCLYYLQSSVMMSLPLFMLRQIGFRDAKDIPIKMYIMGLIVSLAMLVFMRPAFWLTEALCDYSGSAWTTILATVRAIL